MQGDFSRLTFDADHPYSRVLMQQGRVLLDSDWNELVETQLHYLRKLAVDVGGEHWTPFQKQLAGGAAGVADSEAFKIGALKDNDFPIGKGSYYVQGLRGVAGENLSYKNQPDFPLMEAEKKTPFPPSAGEPNLLVYLDVWERHLTHLERESLREVALGGPDTTTRTQIVWQVKALSIAGNPGQEFRVIYQRFIDFLKGKNLFEKSTATLQARAGEPPATNADACLAAPDARYRGAENQLYRVEIHQVDANGKATYKWSRENGSVVFPIKTISGNTVTLEHLGRDERFSLKRNDWVEIVNDDYVLRNNHEHLLKVENVNPEENRIKLAGDPVLSFGEDKPEELSKHPLVRRWDSPDKLNVETPATGEGWLNLEDGIQIKFDLTSKNLRAGDYWLIPARAAIGDILWPKNADGTAKPLEPFGVTHHYAPLALIVNGSPTDLRRVLKQPW